MKAKTICEENAHYLSGSGTSCECGAIEISTRKTAEHEIKVAVRGVLLEHREKFIGKCCCGKLSANHAKFVEHIMRILRPILAVEMAEARREEAGAALAKVQHVRVHGHRFENPLQTLIGWQEGRVARLERTRSALKKP